MLFFVSMYRDKEKYNAWKRAWYAKNSKKEILRKRKYQATQKGREVLYKSNEAYRKRFPEKFRARTIVQARIQRGTLKRLPCKCGREDSQAHHPDYSKPLKIVWLCASCHGQEHRKEKK